METKLTYMTESGIKGRAVAVFGGGILVQTGYNPDNMTGVISLAELENVQEPGSKIKEGTGYYNPQCYLVFKDLASLDIMRDALDNIEFAFKHGELRDTIKELPNRTKAEEMMQKQEDVK